MIMGNGEDFLEIVGMAAHKVMADQAWVKMLEAQMREEPNKMI